MIGDSEPTPRPLNDQIDLVNAKKEDPSSPDFLIFTEHSPIFTIGSRTGAESHLLWDQKTLKDKGIEVHKTNRGGDITYHGPGQLIIYPIISLHRARLSRLFKKT